MDEDEAMAYLIAEEEIRLTLADLDRRSGEAAVRGDWFRASVIAQLRSGLVGGLVNMKNELAIKQLEAESQGRIDE